MGNRAKLYGAIFGTLGVCVCLSFAAIALFAPAKTIKESEQVGVSKQEVVEVIATATEVQPESTFTPTPESTPTIQSEPTIEPTPTTEPTPTPQTFNYEIITETSGATSYIFNDDMKPALDLDKDAGVKDIESVNEVLAILELPLVSNTVQERSSITGQRFHRGQYYWEDYPPGALVIERSLCRNEKYEHYDCIWKVSVGRE